jgi:hypothetical protein
VVFGCGCEVVVEEPADRCDGVGVEVHASVFEGAEDASSDVVGGGAVALSEALDGAAQPGTTETGAVGDQGAAVWCELGREHLEGRGELLLWRIGEAFLERGVLAADVPLMGELGLQRLGGLVLAMEAAYDSGKVGRTFGDITAVGLPGEGGLGAMQHGEREAPKRGNEALQRGIELIGGMQPGEQQTTTAVLGSRTLAAFCGDALEGLRVDSCARFVCTLAGAGAGLVGAQQHRQKQLRHGPGEVDALQRGDPRSQLVGQREQRRHQLLDGAEGALDGGLALRVAFTLRCVLGVELVESFFRTLGEVGRALIGEHLLAGLLVDRLLEHADDVLGALVVVDHDGVEEVLVTSADVLCRDQRELDAEGFELRRVGGELGVGDGHVEAEARSAWRSLPLWLGRRRGDVMLWSGRGAAQPRPQGALGQPQRRAEALLRELRVRFSKPQVGANAERSHGLAAQPKHPEQRGRDLEQRRGDRVLIMVFRRSGARRPAAPRQGGDDALEGGDGAATEPAEALSADLRLSRRGLERVASSRFSVRAIGSFASLAIAWIVALSFGSLLRISVCEDSMRQAMQVVMGSRLRLAIERRGDAAELLRRAFAVARRWDAVLSTYKPESPLSQLNRGALPSGTPPAELLRFAYLSGSVVKPMGPSISASVAAARPTASTRPVGSRGAVADRSIRAASARGWRSTRSSRSCAKRR